MFNALLGEFANIGNINQSCEPIIKQQYSYSGMNQSQINQDIQQLMTQKGTSYLSLVDVLHWLTGHPLQRTQQKKAVSKLTNTKIDTATRNPSTCHFHLNIPGMLLR